MTPCRPLKARFEALLEEFPILEKQLLEVASNELAQAQDQLLLLGRKTAQGKVVSFLLSLSKRSHARGSPASPISLPMSCVDIADYLRLTTETVSNTFTSSKGSDVIRILAGNSVALENFESLSELANGS